MSNNEFFLTDAQIAQIQAIKDAGMQNGNWSHAHRHIASLLPDGAAKTWFLGAALVNANEGPFATLIREFTRHQQVLRGITAPANNLQVASNRIAVKALEDILNIKRNKNNGLWLFPDIESIAANDATGAGEKSFDDFVIAEDTARSTENNAAWSGTILFPVLGAYDQSDRLVGWNGKSGVGDNGDHTLNSLDDVKNVIFALSAFSVAMAKTAVETVSILADGVSGFVSGEGFEKFGPLWSMLPIGGALSVVTDKTQLFASLFGYFDDYLPASAKPIYELADTKNIFSSAIDAALLDNPDTLSFSIIRRPLEFLMASYQGKALSENELTANNYIQKTVDFFAQLTPSILQNTKATLQTHAQIQAQALVKDNSLASLAARNSLKALSPIVVEWSNLNDKAEQLSLYDHKTGQGTLTQGWINDRSAMLGWMLEAYDQGTKAFGVLEVSSGQTGSENWLFEQLGTTAKVRVVPYGAGLLGAALPEHRITFGTEQADTINGLHLADNLYGEGGNDVIKGLGGNDYLEGGLGNDTLDGGTGYDRLFGSAGNDELRAGKTNWMSGTKIDLAWGGLGIDRYVVNQSLTVSNDILYAIETDEASNNIGGRLIINGAQIGSLTLNSFAGFTTTAAPNYYFTVDEDRGVVYVSHGLFVSFQDARLYNYKSTSNHYGLSFNYSSSAIEDISSPPPIDPLALDLDNDGIETVGTQAGILFDHDGDGLKTGTGWLQSDDGWLVLDRNGNGVIDSGQELFGVNTLLSNGSTASDGFSALKAQDTNHDGIVSSADSLFNQLRIWRDLNQDGISQANELNTLNDFGIISIGVNTTNNQLVNLGNGNVQSGAGNFSRQDGTEGIASNQSLGSAVNLNLGTDHYNSEFSDSIPLTTQVESLLLPTVKGHGQVRELAQAAILSPLLVSTLQGYLSATASQQIALLDTVLNQWAATSTFKSLRQQVEDLSALNPTLSLRYNFAGITQGSNDYNVLAQRLSVVERFAGDVFAGARGQRQLEPLTGAEGHLVVSFAANQIAAINKAYDTLIREVYDGLALASDRMKPYVNSIFLSDAPAELTESLSEDERAIIKDYNFSGLEALISTKMANNPQQGLEEALDFIVAYGVSRLSVYGWQPFAFIEQQITAYQEVLQAFEINRAGWHIAIGTEGVGAVNNFLVGTSANDVLNSHSHETSIILAMSGDDTLIAGNGSDYLSGGSGNDILHAGGGNDKLEGGIGNDNLKGAEGDDELQGGAGNDALDGGAGDDTLQGGAGNDRVFGNVGADTYIFNQGDGQDIITNHQFWWSDTFENDRLLLNVNAESLIFRQVSDNLEISFIDSTDKLTITNYFLDDGQTPYTLSQIITADEQIYDYAGIRASVLTPTSGDDGIYGFNLSDTIYGQAGNDSLDGGDGDDYLSGDEGNDYLAGKNGQDTLLGGVGNDELHGGAGNDSIRGGQGNDYLSGGTGDDIFYFKRGDGRDTLNIVEYFLGEAGNDQFIFEGIYSTQVQVRYVTGSVSSYTSYGYQNTALAQIYIPDSQEWFLLPSLANGLTAISAITFADGVSWTGSDIVQKVSITEGDDVLLIGTYNQGTLSLLGGNDNVQAFEGSVRLNGAAGNDQLYGSQEQDNLYGGTGNDTLSGGDANDTLNGDADNDTLMGDAGNDTLTGGIGADILMGGTGDDDYWIDTADTIIEANNEGNDTVYTSNTYTLGSNIENAVLQSTDEATNLIGNNLNNILTAGKTLKAHLYNSNGANQLAGGLGDDTYKRVSNNDVVIEQANAGIDTVYFSGDYLNLWDNVENVVLEALQDVYFTSTFMQRVNGNALDNRITANSAVRSEISGGDGNDTLIGLNGDDWLQGGNGNDTLLGGAGDDSLEGNGGYNVIDGGAGTNYISMGSYVAGDKGVHEIYGGQGTNIITMYGTSQAIIHVGQHDKLNYTGQYVTGGAGIINLRFDAFSLNEGVLSLEANGDVSIQFGSSHFTMNRQAIKVIQSIQTSDGIMLTADWLQWLNNHPDHYRTYAQGSFATSLPLAEVSLNLTRNGSEIQFNNSVVTRSGDTVQLINPSSVPTTDALSFLDGLSLQADKVHIKTSGGEADVLSAVVNNVELMVGTTANDIFVSTQRSLTQIYAGGQGQDTYRFGLGDGSDEITASAQETGQDRVELLNGLSTGNVTFRRENTDLWLDVLGTNDHLKVTDYFGIGDSVGVFQWQDGSVRNRQNILANFGASDGNDILQGTVNDDTLYGFAGNDTLSGQAGEDTLWGDAGNDTLFGGLGNDILFGGLGNDSMLGGAGHDQYEVDSINDVVIENANEGTDTVYSTISYQLTANVEELWLKGVAINGIGNALDNRLYGNNANNRLDGGLGADYMEGGAGDDTYVVNQVDDEVYEYEDNQGDTLNGIDTVESSISYTLGENLENLTLIGTAAINGTGNFANNRLVGNSAANILKGGAGNDTYVVGTGDTVTELANQGIDTIESGITWTLGSNLENLTLTGTAAINGTGNNLANTIIGNSAINTLNGGTGADLLIGGQGNDTYVVDNVGDVTTENANEGIDTVQSSITWTLAANVENLTLTGSTAINGTGNILDNILTGNSAKNILKGGAGNDTYVVGTGDTVTELANEGIDTVQSSITWTLAANIENLTLTGSTAINGTGNILDNILTGNSAKNILKGGAGNDTYVVGTGDTVTELANEGIDTVQSSIAWTLAANIENLTLTGTTAVNGTGNTLANTLMGNSANNTLTGLAGNDTYLFNAGWATDTIVDNDATANNLDIARFGSGISRDQLWFKKNGTNLEVTRIGTTDKLIVSNWYTSTAYHVEQFKTNDNFTLDHNKVAQLVQAMSTMTPPPAGQTTLTAQQHSQLDAVIASSWV